jgi:hypothetical protein
MAYLPKNNLTNREFDFLTVIGRSKSKKWYWICKCKCGKIKEVLHTSLTSRNTRSCGCLRKSSMPKTHGMSKTREYRIWSGMKNRCNNENTRDYMYYGLKGVRVCRRWNLSFNNFIEDMGLAPSRLHTIERVDGSGGYSKNNCRWATRMEQSRNCSHNHPVTVDGKSRTISGWSEVSGVLATTIRKRLVLGWDAKEAVFKPPRFNRMYHV